MTGVAVSEDYRCGHENAPAFDSRIAGRLGLSFPRVHGDASAMALLASEVRKDSGGRICSLPFCCTVEAEALGGRVEMGDGKNGPRAGDPVFGSLKDLRDGLGGLDFSRGRLREVLEACRLLRARGEHASVEVSGPLTLLNGLMDLSRVFREWRKDGLLMREVLDRLGRELLGYVAELKAVGADILSFADPTATPDILGPRYSSMLAESFFVPFLKEAELLLDANAVMQVCPRISRMLIASGFAEWTPVDLGHPVFYDEGCLECRGKTKLLGQSCIRNRAFFLHDGKMQALRLK